MRSKDAIEWPTLVMMALCYAAWGAGLMLWPISGLASVVLTAAAIALFSSLQHEVLHGHPFRSQALNEALVFAGLTLFIPYQRFRDTHLQHHFDPALTDPYDDPESNYMDPATWARLGAATRVLLRANNTLLGRMVIGPALSTYSFARGDLRRIRDGDRAVLRAWVLHGVGVAMVLAVVGATAMPLWAYGLAAYVGFALLKIRTFLEHRAHTAFRARTVVVEDRGPLSYLFLNNNFHVVHHSHPQVAWYQLPALYQSKRAQFLRRNGGYVYRSYGVIFRQFLLRAKDPVPHPIWTMPSQPAEGWHRPGVVKERDAGMGVALQQGFDLCQDDFGDEGQIQSARGAQADPLQM